MQTTMNFKLFLTGLLLSAICAAGFSENTGGNDWWRFLDKKYHFNIEKNLDVYHETGNGYSIMYFDLKFDNFVLEHKSEKNGKTIMDTSKDFVIKYEKKETQGDVIHYTNALLVKKGENGHEACKANHISVNKNTKEISAKTCSFSRLFDNPSFSH